MAGSPAAALAASDSSSTGSDGRRTGEVVVDGGPLVGAHWPILSRSLGHSVSGSGDDHSLSAKGHRQLRQVVCAGDRLRRFELAIAIQPRFEIDIGPPEQVLLVADPLAA